MAEVAMHEASMNKGVSPAEAVRQVAAASELFLLDHNIRRLPAAMAAGMSGNIPIGDVIPHLEVCLARDPNARDVRAQLTEARAFLSKSRTKH